jgi:toxin ParE1/3/4
VKLYKVDYQESATEDIESIYRWIYKVSLDPVTAQRFTDRIWIACERIGDVPYGGRSRDDLWPGLRTMPFERSAVIAYRVLDDRVQIVNVFYGGRDYEALYRKDGV